MPQVVLEFERPLLELEDRILELRRLRDEGADLKAELAGLEHRAERLKEDLFAALTPWQVVQVSRHPARPYTLDYIAALTQDFQELHGDRRFRDDPAIVGGLCTFDGQTVMVIGHQKGRNTRENLLRNFGMPGPEGYRKAQRLMALADRFRVPIITFIDTPGAYPGLGAEERGQAEAIAQSLEQMAGLRVPIIAVVIGEGGSGGALALGVANRILMLKYAIYSVISPEGCASILWKDGSRAAQAAQVLKLRAEDIFHLGIADEIINEPGGGAHRAPEQAAALLGESLSRHLRALTSQGPDALVEQRYQKFRCIGVFAERSAKLRG